MSSTLTTFYVRCYNKYMNIIGYVGSNKQDFTQSHLNEADSLVLSQLAYLAYPRKFASAPGSSIAELAEETEVLIRDTFYPKSNAKLIKAVAASPRFGNIKVGYFRQRNCNEKVLRFAAVTFILPDGTAYISFRGTDTTVLGWKEDFYMSFLSRIPSHLLAEEYLDFVARNVDGKLILGGHSKGGNLAVYSATNCSAPIRARIVSLFNHDGPGFKDSIYETDRYLSVKDRIHKTIPRDSLVGLILSTDNDYKVVDCNSLLLMQHNPFTWHVTKDGSFKKLTKISYSSRVFDATLTNWIDSMDLPTRRKLVGAIFDVLEGCGYTNVTDISKNLVSSMRGMYKAYKALSDEGKALMSDGGKQLLKLWMGTVFTSRKNNKNKDGKN